MGYPMQIFINDERLTRLENAGALTAKEQRKMIYKLIDGVEGQE